jgi:hypothetical protein
VSTSTIEIEPPLMGAFQPCSLTITESALTIPRLARLTLDNQHGREDPLTP